MAQLPDDRTSAELRAQAAQYRMLARTAPPSLQKFLYDLADRLEARADDLDAEQE